MPDGSKTSLGRKYQEHFPLQSWSVSVDFKTPLRPNIKSLRLPCKYSSPLWQRQEFSCLHSTLTPAGLQCLRILYGCFRWAEQPAFQLNCNGLHKRWTDRSDPCACVSSSQTLPSPFSHWWGFLSLSSYTQLSVSAPGPTASVLRTLNHDGKSPSWVLCIADFHGTEIKSGWMRRSGFTFKSFCNILHFNAFQFQVLPLVGIAHSMIHDPSISP